MPCLACPFSCATCPVSHTPSLGPVSCPGSHALSLDAPSLVPFVYSLDYARTRLAYLAPHLSCPMPRLLHPVSRVSQRRLSYPVLHALSCMPILSCNVPCLSCPGSHALS